MKTGMRVERSEAKTENAALDETPDAEAREGDSAEISEEGQEILENSEEKSEGESVKKTREFKADPNSVRTIEAALFLANRLVPFEELAAVAGVNKLAARTLAETLCEEYEQKQGAIEVEVSEEGASLQVKPEFLQKVSGLSKKSDLSRKATKILALVAKKGGILQSELKKYFRGEIYQYTTELKQAGYVDAEKRGNTRFLKPSKKFSSTFQVLR